MIRKPINHNCGYCVKYKDTCDGNDRSCICRSCPRNLGECLITKYCKETESVLDLEIKDNKNRDDLIKEYFKDR